MVEKLCPLLKKDLSLNGSTRKVSISFLVYNYHLPVLVSTNLCALFYKEHYFKAATTNMNIMSPIYELSSNFMNPGAHTLGMALLFAAFFPVGSFISSALLGWLDNRLQHEASADGFDRIEEERGQIRSRRSSQSSTKEMENRSLFPKINSNLEFWLLAGICFLYFGAVTPFIGIAEMWFQVIYGFSQSEASFLNSIIFILSMVLSPVFGFIIDRVGFNLYFILGTVTELMTSSTRH